MKNIHVLPTDKPSRLRIGDNRNFVFGLVQSAIVSKNDSYTNLNIYITSDEEITGFENNIWVIKGNRIFLWQNTMALVSNNKPKKIILTTDQDLIADGVQAIDDEFLEWFVKNPSCEEVKIKVEFIQTPDNLKDGFYYKIIIPKEELIDCEYCGGDGIYVDGDNNTSKCTMCEKGKVPKEEPTEEAKQRAKNYMRLKGALEPKQETFEETYNKWSLEKAKEFALSKFTKDSNPKKGVVKWEDILEVLKVGVLTGYKFGRKFQGERMYSEEEVRKILWEYIKPQSTSEGILLDGFLEQFKKK